MNDRAVTHAVGNAFKEMIPPLPVRAVRAACDQRRALPRDANLFGTLAARGLDLGGR
ncbi:MAG: hypothetical protein ACRDS1_08880 [Pseudonocardiaceae bacterium]